MSERFQELYALPSYLYAKDVPLVVSAGKLYKNTASGRLFIQLRMQNISANFEKIKAAKVLISCFDVGGRFATEKEYQYLDLCVKRGEEFGSKIPIYLDLPTIRSFEVKVAEVFWEGDTSWSGSQYEWVSLGKPKTLEESLGQMLAGQYRRDTFADAKYEVFAAEAVWVCACGAINYVEESLCCKCRNNKAKLFLALDHNTLSKHFSARQDAQREEAEKKAAEKKKNTIKVVLTVLLIAAVLLGIDVHNDRQRKAAIQEELVGKTWGYEDSFDPQYGPPVSWGESLEFRNKEKCILRYVGEDYDFNKTYKITAISGNKATIVVSSNRYTIRYTIDGEGNCTIWEFSDGDALYKKMKG